MVASVPTWSRTIGNGVAFAADDEGKRSAVALAHDDDALALAGTVRFEAAVLAVLVPVLRLRRSRRNRRRRSRQSPFSLRPACSRAMASRSLWDRTKAVLYCTSRSRLIWRAETPFAPFTKITMAASRSVKRQLAAGEDRPAGDAELMVAGDALEAAARGDVVSLDTAAARANGLAFRLRPTQLAERP